MLRLMIPIPALVLLSACAGEGEPESALLALDRDVPRAILTFTCEDDCDHVVHITADSNVGDVEIYVSEELATTPFLSVELVGQGSVADGEEGEFVAWGAPYTKFYIELFAPRDENWTDTELEVWTEPGLEIPRIEIPEWRL